MAVRFLPYPLFQAFKDDGTPLEGGKVYVYAAGTTNAITTWADFNKNSANTHPVILNSRGEAAIWFDAPAKIVLKDSNGVTIWTEDNIRPTTSQSLTGNYNLVENGSFELDGDGDGEPDSWTVQLYNSSTSSQSLDTSEVAHGAQSLKFQSTGDGGGTATSDFFNVLDGGEHTVAFTIKSTVAGVRNVVEVHWHDKSQTFLSKTAIYDDNTTNPTSFTRKYFNATAPANATFGKLVLIGCHESDSTSGSTWFDDVIFIKEGMFFSGATGEVTADASELNKTDGLTATTSELNTMAGITATASELNTMDGITATTADLNNADESATAGGGFLKGPTTSSDPSLAFDTWRTPNTNRPTLVQIEIRVETDGTTQGRVDVSVDESGGTAADYSFPVNVDPNSSGSGGETFLSARTFLVPAGGSYQILNTTDPNNNNAIVDHREFTL